jgi:hypothetical protein
MENHLIHFIEVANEHKELTPSHTEKEQRYKVLQPIRKKLKTDIENLINEVKSNYNIIVVPFIEDSKIEIAFAADILNLRLDK